jgi:hypothetical protein
MHSVRLSSRLVPSQTSDCSYPIYANIRIIEKDRRGDLRLELARSSRRAGNSVNTSVSYPGRTRSVDSARWRHPMTLLPRRFRSSIWDSRNDISRFSLWP